MNKRKLLIGLTTAGLFSAGFGAAVLPAGAQERTLTITLLDGTVKTVTVDVPPGTPLDQIVVPGVTTPIVSISDSAATPAPAPAPIDEPVAEDRKVQKKTGERSRKAKRDIVEKVEVVVPKKVRPAPRPKKTRFREADGLPTAANPTFSLALPGPAPIGVPNFFIDKFRIPPFLLPIYQAAGIQYGIRWEVLAAINEIETDYGRNLNVSSAGALGWMQFMPATWKMYGTDANKDGTRDPYNPVDAIFAAARYLRAAGAEKDLSKAIFAYNHADWYVDSVLLRARVIGGLPADLVGSLTGLTQGRFPVRATARYADEHRPGVNVFADPGSAVVAVQDGKVVKTGRTKRLGRFVQLRDPFGNTYTYAKLSQLARTPSLERSVTKERLFAHPERAPLPDSSATRKGAAPRSVSSAPRVIRAGTRVTGGTVLGRVGRQGYLKFEIRPAGRGAPRIDPKPILDGWKLLESTAIYRATGKNALLGKDPTIGQLLLMSKAQLQRRVLSNPRIEVYGCGRRDIRAGIIDRRVLATLELLAASGLEPTVSSLRCGHGYYTKGGSVSHHSFGAAVDISKINGIPIIGHQGRGSVAEMAVQRLLTLQGAMKPAQIISLMTFQGADNTFAMGDHADHIHVGWRPLYGSNTKLGRQLEAVLKPGQWIKLVDRIGEIGNPVLSAGPS
jgi:murein DD-endopeptidase MepM/ murein hydrolase activator NlpD